MRNINRKRDIENTNSRLTSVLIVAVVEFYTQFTLFVFAPTIAFRVDAWIWISIVSLFLITAHFAACYLLRDEKPWIWLAGIPMNVVAVIALSNINMSFFIDSLSLYGIFSKYATELDSVLTFVPYQIDSVLFASLIVSGRISFAAPAYYLAKSNKVSSETAEI